MNSFTSEFWQILLSCLSAGVVDFAVLARLTEGLLGVTSCSLFRMSGANSGRRPRSLLGDKLLEFENQGRLHSSVYRI